MAGVAETKDIFLPILRGRLKKVACGSFQRRPRLGGVTGACAKGAMSIRWTRISCGSETTRRCASMTTSR